MPYKVIRIVGAADLQLTVLGTKYFDRECPFDFSVPLKEEGAFSHDFGPVTVLVGLSGDTVSIAANIVGFPLFQKAFSLSNYATAIGFDFGALGEHVAGSISLEDVKANSKLGWHPDRADKRDLMYLQTAAKLPASVDLRTACSSVVDQGELGSCTANAIAAALRFDAIAQGADRGDLSRLFIYWGERNLEHTLQEDSGAQIRDGIKFVANSGSCLESTWPYDITKFKVKPSENCWTAATQFRASSYHRVSQTHSAIRSALASGRPVVFGFTVYSSFMSDNVARTGVMPMPTARDTIEGGHAVLMVGYDDVREAYLVRNSWGAGWGIGGYFWMPYAYAENKALASDFWVISTVGKAA